MVVAVVVVIVVVLLAVAVVAFPVADPGRLNQQQQQLWQQGEHDLEDLHAVPDDMDLDML